MADSPPSDTRPGAGPRLAFHLSRIVIDLGVLMAVGSLSLPFITAPSGDRSAIDADVLPAVLLLVPVFLITLIPDHVRPVPKALGWLSLVLGATALPYAIVQRIDAVVLAETIDGQVGAGFTVLIAATVVVLAGIVYGLIRAAFGIQTGGSATRTKRVPRGAVAPAPATETPPDPQATAALRERVAGDEASAETPVETAIDTAVDSAAEEPAETPAEIAAEPAAETPAEPAAETTAAAAAPQPAPVAPSESRPAPAVEPTGTPGTEPAAIPDAGAAPVTKAPPAAAPAASEADPARTPLPRPGEPVVVPPAIAAPRTRRPVLEPPAAPKDEDGEVDDAADPVPPVAADPDPDLVQIDLELSDIPQIEATGEVDEIPED